ncbi:hypothetical protein AB0N09_35475 [Streptomyces erythrochromogenes]|uniref:hypothetical protein n=1 Tax=Streptomyces erythrochromogenes TaxID=285574 RepID=UPI00343057AC
MELITDPSIPEDLHRFLTPEASQMISDAYTSECLTVEVATLFRYYLDAKCNPDFDSARQKAIMEYPLSEPGYHNQGSPLVATSLNIYDSDSWIQIFTQFQEVVRWHQHQILAKSEFPAPAPDTEPGADNPAGGPAAPEVQNEDEPPAFPMEILKEISGYLDLRELVRYSATNKELREKLWNGAKVGSQEELDQAVNLVLKGGLKLKLIVIEADSVLTVKKDPEIPIIALSSIKANTGLIVAQGAIDITVAGKAFLRASGSVNATASGNARVDAYDDSIVTVKDEAHVNAYNRTTVNADDQATVKAYHRTQVVGRGGSVIETRGHAGAELHGGAQGEAYQNSSITASGRTTVRAHSEAHVTASGWATVLAFSKAHVLLLRDYTGQCNAYNESEVECYGGEVQAFNKAQVTAYLGHVIVRDESTRITAHPQARVTRLNPPSDPNDCQIM